MRRRIAFQLTAIWLAVAIPLSVILAVTYFLWYQAQVSLVEEQRIGYARLSGTSFRLIVSQIEQTERLVGADILRLGVSSPAATQELRRVVASFPAEHLVLTDVRGRVVTANDQELVGDDLSGHAAFEKALRSSTGRAIEAADTELQRAAGFHVAQRINAPSGRPLGVMMMLVDVRKLHRVFPVSVSEGGISVVDSAGQVIFQNEDIRFAARRERWGDRFPFIREALRGRVATTRDFRFPLGGRRIGAFVPIEPLGWAAGSSVDANAALAPFYRTLAVALPLGVLLTAVALGASTLIARGITFSLRSLGGDARRIGEGDFAKPVRIERQDEIGDVARSLEKARLSLKRYVSENDRLFEEQRQDAELDRALADIYSILHATLNFREILARVLERAVQAIGCELAGVNLLEDNHWVRLGAYGLPEEHLGEILPERHTKLPDLVAETGQPVIINDTSSDSRIDSSVAGKYGVKSVMVFPLLSKRKVAGTVFFGFRSKPMAFSDTQVDFASKLTHSLSLAYENARLYESERDIAETLQTALLALPERLPRIEFAHAYHSATEAARVGGDFYDLFELEHGLLGLTVGDISGHGIDAAVLTSLVKSTIRSRATEQDKTPAEAIEAANTVLFRSSPPDVFATVFFGVLNREDGRLVYCNAGHTTGILVSTGRKLVQVQANSPLVGAFEEGRFQDSEQRLVKDDLLFLYTDGLIEARRDRELFGEERLFEVLAAGDLRDPSDAVSKVLDKVLAFSRGQLSDDLAILALRRVDG